ncbi:hypothetical protein N7513_006817 [Penicillium frequentans]|nr:hypothetical protein N7513_006817 [Penicillium glabrum]
MGLDSISLATQILCFSIVPPLIALRVFAKYKLHLPFGIDDDYVHGSLHLNIILYENELKMIPILEATFLTAFAPRGIVGSNTRYLKL